MSGTMTDPASQPGAHAPRPRNAAASRQALLDAAQGLFSQKGFEATTVREIGEAASVDPALIARYFGSKAELYIAAVAVEGASERPQRYERPAQIAEVMMARMDAGGPGPILQAVLRSDTTKEIRDAAKAHLVRRMVQPLEEDMDTAGVDRARLRAETAVAAVLGVALGRSLGWFSELGGVDRHELVALLDESLDALVPPALD